MKIKNIKAHFRAQKEEQQELPWFIRTSVKYGEYLQYIFFKYIVNFPRELKYDYQIFMHGYSEEDVFDLGGFMINKIHAPLKKFVKYEKEHGLALPSEFATNPAGWIEALDKIEFAVDHAWNENHDTDYDPTRGMGVDEVKEFYQSVDEGFLLLGKFMRNMYEN